jgi:hypothetical protein
VQRRFLGADSRVAGDQVELRDRHVERRLVGVLELEELAGFRVVAAERDRRQAEVAADAVVDVNDRVADVELGEVLDQRVDVARLLLAAPPARAGRHREQLGFGDELDRSRVVDGGAFGTRRETLRERRDGDREALVARFELGQRRDARRVDAAVAQQLEQAFAPAFALGDDEDAMRRRRDVHLEALERLGCAAVDAEVGQDGRPRLRVVALAAQRQQRVRGAGGEELLGLQEQRFGRQDRALAVMLEETMALAGVGPEALQRLVDLAVERERRVGAEVVEDGRRLVEEERQVELDPRRRDAGADVLVEAHPGRVAFEALAPARPKGVPRRLVHRELAAGQEPDLGHRVEASLRVRIEGADRVDLVAEQVDAVRHRRAHREQVDQAAAHGVLAGRDDLAHVGVAGERELRLQRRLVEALPGREVERVAGHERRRREANERRRRRHQDDVDVAAPDSPERREPLRDQVLVRREGVVGQRLPVGKDGDAKRRREERDLVGEPLRVGGLGGEDRDDLGAGALLLGEAGEQEGVGRTGRAGQREALAGGDVGEEHEGGRKSHAA